MAQLKAVIFSLRNVFFDEQDNQVGEGKLKSLINLIIHLAKKDIKVILHSNDRWVTVTTMESVAVYLSKVTNQTIRYYNKEDYPDIPKKPKAEAIPYILRRENLQKNEIIYVGCNTTDWQACINSKILFIKANWIKADSQIPYGFSFDDMAALARFIDICCIKANENPLISYKNEYIEFYTLSPFSTYKTEFEAYSSSARSTAKQLTCAAEPDFWLMLLIARIYFSGLYEEINIIMAFPGHKIGFGNPTMDLALDTFSKCFRLSYLHDGLIRHTQSIKSQNARNQGQSNLLGIYNHLNTLHINKNPNKFGTEKPLKSTPYKNKTVLLIDDIATAGYSLDAASLLIKAAGAKRVICFSWLKTINTPLYVSTNSLSKNYPVFTPISNSQELFTNSDPLKICYGQIIPSSSKGTEMSQLFRAFLDWKAVI